MDFIHSTSRKYSMDRHYIHKRLGLKYRSLKRYMGWGASIIGFISVVWVYTNVEHAFQRLPGPISSYIHFRRADPDTIHTLGQRALTHGHYHDAIKVFQYLLEANTTAVPSNIMATSSYGLIRSFIALHQLKPARLWTDWYYYNIVPLQGEPAYHLCRALREDGQSAAAFYYYLMAEKTLSSSAAISYIPAEHEICDYLLDYEKSILWSYLGDSRDSSYLLHGLTFSMRMLENPKLPEYIRDSVFSNLQYYVSNLDGQVEVLRSKDSLDEGWHYSSPTFIGDETLIHVVNYYISEDGIYHVSKGDHGRSRLLSAATDKDFEIVLSETFEDRVVRDGLHHDDAYILGLEDTRAVVDVKCNNTIFTLSASQEYSRSPGVISQVLGTLNLEERKIQVEAVLEGPGMRGSTNGVLYREQWWFVTHSHIYREGQMRKYLHYLVVLNQELSAIVRYSLPFSFEEGSDIEFCLGLKVEESGIVFGYSAKEKSTKIMRIHWPEMGRMFN
ncbi:hypothetical protein VYU27_007791 [Nannochloropsis oceanica]